MISEYRYKHLVGFSETDMAGIVHFANFFRYMELAEHAFLSSLGFSVHPRSKNGDYDGFPRVHASCDFQGPVYFEDELDIHLQIVKKSRRALGYRFTMRVKEQIVATGSVVTVCMGRDEATGAMKSIDIPAGLAGLIAVVERE